MEGRGEKMLKKLGINPPKVPNHSNPNNVIPKHSSAFRDYESLSSFNSDELRLLQNDEMRAIQSGAQNDDENQINIGGNLSHHKKCTEWLKKNTFPDVKEQQTSSSSVFPVPHTTDVIPVTTDVEGQHLQSTSPLQKINTDVMSAIPSAPVSPIHQDTLNPGLQHQTTSSLSPITNDVCNQDSKEVSDVEMAPSGLAMNIVTDSQRILKVHKPSTNDSLNLNAIDDEIPVLPFGLLSRLATFMSKTAPDLNSVTNFQRILEKHEAVAVTKESLPLKVSNNVTDSKENSETQMCSGHQASTKLLPPPSLHQPGNKKSDSDVASALPDCESSDDDAPLSTLSVLLKSKSKPQEKKVTFMRDVKTKIKRLENKKLPKRKNPKINLKRHQASEDAEEASSPPKISRLVGRYPFGENKALKETKITGSENGSAPYLLIQKNHETLQNAVNGLASPKHPTKDPCSVRQEISPKVLQPSSKSNQVKEKNMPVNQKSARRCLEKTHNDRCPLSSTNTSSPFRLHLKQVSVNSILQSPNHEISGSLASQTGSKSRGSQKLDTETDDSFLDDVPDYLLEKDGSKKEVASLGECNGSSPVIPKPVKKRSKTMTKAASLEKSTVSSPVTPKPISGSLASQTGSKSRGNEILDTETDDFFLDDVPDCLLEKDGSKKEVASLGECNGSSPVIPKPVKKRSKTMTKAASLEKSTVSSPVTPKPISGSLASQTGSKSRGNEILDTETDDSFLDDVPDYLLEKDGSKKEVASLGECNGSSPVIPKPVKKRSKTMTKAASLEKSTVSSPVTPKPISGSLASQTGSKSRGNEILDTETDDSFLDDVPECLLEKDGRNTKVASLGKFTVSTPVTPKPVKKRSKTMTKAASLEKSTVSSPVTPKPISGSLASQTGSKSRGNEILDTETDDSFLDDVPECLLEKDGRNTKVASLGKFTVSTPVTPKPMKKRSKTMTNAASLEKSTVFSPVTPNPLKMKKGLVSKKCDFSSSSKTHEVLAIPLDLSVVSQVGLNEGDLQALPSCSSGPTPTSTSRYHFRKRGSPAILPDSEDSEEDFSDGDSHGEWKLSNPALRFQSKRKQASDDGSSDSEFGSDDASVVGAALTLPKKHLKKLDQRKKVSVTRNDTEDNATEVHEWEEGDLNEVTRPPASFSLIAESLGAPLEYFEYFIDDEMIASITNFTNSYTTFQSNGQKCINVTTEEIRKFLGLWIFMGVVKLPSLKDYWAADTYISQVARIMTYNRFQSIRSSLHLYEKSEEDSLDQADRYRKVSFLLNRLKEKCNGLEQENIFSIDETMVPYKGTFAKDLRMYIKSKPHKFGFKIYSLAGKSGLIYDFLPYAGASTFQNSSFSPEERNMGHGAMVVLHLVKSIDRPEEATVYFDNYFTSVKLLRHLKTEYGILATGTIRSDRIEHCPLLTQKELEKKGRGSYDTKVKDGIQVIKWLDSKPVHVASTLAGVHPLGEANRYNRAAKARVEVPIPRAVELYNSNMGGVDLNDMMVELYRIPTRARRWYLSLVGYAIDLAVVNSWIIYKRHAESLNHKNILNSKQFRLSVSKSLRGVSSATTTPSGSRIRNVIKAPRGHRPDSSVQFDGINHWPTLEETQGRCKYCKAGFTSVMCSKCELHLCIVPQRRNCFAKFHQK